MEDVILWLIIGLIAGSVASFVVPGRTPGGVLGAIIIGILGGVLGGWVLDAMDINEDLTWIGSLVVAVIGAIVILYAMRATNRTSRV